MSEKCSKSNKNCASVAHFGIELPCLPCMALCGLLWPFVALYGLVWPYVALYALMWPRMALMLFFTAMIVCGLIRFSMALRQANSFPYHTDKSTEVAFLLFHLPYKITT